MTDKEKKLIFDAYCDVCGHYAHKTPHYICRQKCEYFDEFKSKIETMED